MTSSARFGIKILYSSAVFENDWIYSNKDQKWYFFRYNNISSHGFFSFFIIFCIGFTRTEKKYVKVIDYDICNRKIEFNAKSEMMKRNRNWKKGDKKIWRVLKCKEIVALRDFLYKAWFVQFCISFFYLLVHPW